MFRVVRVVRGLFIKVLIFVFVFVYRRICSELLGGGDFRRYFSVRVRFFKGF